ncbi:DUF3240 family protein [Methylophaga sp.]|uniref:DUF3240 family protein n=1 Tax=Methylophaga sp. TaxID=2024840 RepID=UPI003F6A01FD
MKQLLGLIVRPNLEEAMGDWLLMHPKVSGVTLQKAEGYGSHHVLSVSEQVKGGQTQRLFWVEVSSDDVDAMLQELKQEFVNAPIHYWLLPLTSYGSLADYSPD